MAIDKKTLQMLLNNPAMVKAHELGMEDDPSHPQDKMPDEDSETDPASMLDQHPDDQKQDEEVASIPQMKTPDVDSELMAKLKKLKAGEPADDSSDESKDADVASNMQATTDMRKKAMDMIKRKYLGQ